MKAADKISAVIKCVEERISGNRDFSKAEQTITQAIRDMGLPEADYFMDQFLPSYGLTIEEQDYTREAGLKFSESSQLVFSKVLPEKGPGKRSGAEAPAGSCPKHRGQGRRNGNGQVSQKPSVYAGSGI